MTTLAAGGSNKMQDIQVVGVGTLQEITAVGAAATIIFFAFGAADVDASSGDRIPMPPDIGMFWKIAPGQFVAAYDGSAGGAAADPVGADTTVVYLYYDSTAGTAYVLECA